MQGQPRQHPHSLEHDVRLLHSAKVGLRSCHITDHPALCIFESVCTTMLDHIMAMEQSTSHIL